MNRHEYQLRARANAKRGRDLPQTKLAPADVVKIRRAAALRDRLRQRITDRLSNEALAKKLGVHVRTVEKALRYETHIGVRDV